MMMMIVIQYIISATSELVEQLQQKFKFNLGFDDREKAGHG